jgi:hypothetical protein
MDEPFPAEYTSPANVALAIVQFPGVFTITIPPADGFAAELKVRQGTPDMAIVPFLTHVFP